VFDFAHRGEAVAADDAAFEALVAEAAI